MTDIIKEIYVPLLDEGAFTIRPTLARDLGDAWFEILPVDPKIFEDEVWEYMPGTIVKCDWVKSIMSENFFWRAYAKRDPNGGLIFSTELPTDPNHGKKL